MLGRREGLDGGSVKELGEEVGVGGRRGASDELGGGGGRCSRFLEGEEGLYMLEARSFIAAGRSTYLERVERLCLLHIKISWPAA